MQVKGVMTRQTRSEKPPCLFKQGAYVLSSRSRAHQPFSDNSFALPAQNAQQRKITKVLLLIRIVHII